MADKTIRTDDLDGESLATERICFSLRGKDYEIDLSEEHLHEFDAALKPYTEKAREIERPNVVPMHRASRSGRQQPTRSKEDVARVRDWATKNGHKVSERGRIPTKVLKAYEEAHRQ
ncbi:Lsr2 family protein [Geodermatophilus sp. SYSU D00758]